jgi:hypothetical protein
MAYKKARTSYGDDRFCSQVCDIYEFYDFVWEKIERQESQLKQRSAKIGANDLDDHLIDEWMALRDMRAQLGSAVTVMLSSALEQRLMRRVSRLGLRKRYDALRIVHPRKGVLELSAELFKETFGCDFKAKPAVLFTAPRPMPEGVHTDFRPLFEGGPNFGIPSLDFKLITDFLWLRNQIVHKGWVVDAATADGRSVHRLPANGILLGDTGELSAANNTKRMIRLSADKDYILKVTPHLIALMDIIHGLTKSKSA